MFTEMQVQNELGEQTAVCMLVNDWVEVQGGLYRYLAISDSGGVAIRIVIADYVACEVAWGTSDL